MYMGSRDAIPEFSCGRKEHLKDCLDELLDAAEDQVDSAYDVVDIIRDLRVELSTLINR